MEGMNDLTEQDKDYVLNNIPDNNVFALSTEGFIKKILKDRRPPPLPELPAPSTHPTESNRIDLKNQQEGWEDWVLKSAQWHFIYGKGAFNTLKFGEGVINPKPPTTYTANLSRK